jgi:hypothetical protein
MKSAAVGVLMIVGALTTSAYEQPVDVRVSSPFATAPADVMVTATVVPDERNRVLVISAESPDYLRRSTMELDGVDEARVHQMWLSSLPEGDYVVTARVIGSDGPRAVANVKLQVMPGRKRGSRGSR